MHDPTFYHTGMPFIPGCDPVRTLLTTQSRTEPVATSSGLYPSHQIAENIELPSIVPSTLSHPLSSNVTPTQTPSAQTIARAVWGN